MNLMGNLLPLLVALATIPLLIDGLGADRFGVLTLAWTAIGYFGLFDFGVGRALTQGISAALGVGRHGEIGGIVWTALGLMFVLGLVGSAALWATAPWLMTDVLKVPGPMQREGITAFRLLAVSLPFVVTTAGLRGIMEAYQHFGVATALRMPYALFTFIGPLAVLPFSRHLDAVVGSLVAARVALWAAHLVVVIRRYPGVRAGPLWSRGSVGPLLRTGGWITVSNVVSPLMVNVDRYLIAGLIGTSAVAYYVTPFELANKLLLIPGALLAVLFPAFASSFVSDPALTARRADQALRVMLILMYPLCLLFVALAPEGLRVWVGPVFAREGAAVLQWLAAGMLINALGHVPFGALQGIGRSDLTAKLHVVELPLYLAILTLLATRYGIVGVAIAWTIRVTMDTGVLLVAMRRRLPVQYDSLLVGRALVPLLGGMALVGIMPGTIARWTTALLLLGGFAAFAFTRLVRDTERELLTRPLRRSGAAGQGA